MGLKDLAAKLEESSEDKREAVQADAPERNVPSLTDDAFDAPMMIMNQIHEA